MRAEFEAFLASEMVTISPELLFERRGDGEYVSLVAHYSWKAWQAALASQAKNVPNLEDCHYEYPVVDPAEESEAGMWPVLVPNGFKIVKDNQPTDEAVDELREVYEAARQFLRYYGVDKDRSSKALERLEFAIETVKNIDGGYKDFPLEQPTDDRVQEAEIEHLQTRVKELTQAFNKFSNFIQSIDFEDDEAVPVDVSQLIQNGPIAIDKARKEESDDRVRELEAKILDLPRYSFLSPKEGGVRRYADTSGAWIERWEVIKLLEAMKEVNQ